MLLYVYISIYSIVFTFLFQRPKYCITNRSRWQPICGKVKTWRLCIVPLRFKSSHLRIYIKFSSFYKKKKKSSFQVARCHDLRIADRLLAFRRRNRSGNLSEHILGGGGLSRGAVRGCLGAGKGLCREALGARPEV